MKCENCGHLVSDGYEYPEYFCELGIADNPKFAKYDTGDGCSLTKKQRIKLCEDLKDMGLLWNESEDKQ